MASAKALRGAARSAVRQGSFVLSGAFAISFAVNVLRLAGPMFMLLIYDRVLTSRSVETLVALFVLLMGLLVVLGTLDYARKRMLARFGAQFQERMEDTLLVHTKRSQLFQHGKSKPAQGLDEVDGLRGFMHSGSLISIFDFLWTPMFIAVVFILHPTLGWVCIGGIGIIGLLMLVQMLFLGGRQEQASKAGKAVQVLKNMLVASHETVRSQDMGPGYKARWKSARDAARDSAITLRDWTSWFNSMAKITVMVVRYSVLATGAYLALQGQLTPGAMVAATFLVTRVLGPVDRFVGQIPNIFKAREQWAQLNRILAKQAQEVEDGYAEQTGAPNRLVMNNVSVKSPRTGMMILRGISFTARAGELIEITGTSSQGKTVLAQTIQGMWPSASGSILIEGHNMSRLGDIEAQKAIGYASATPSFIAGTIEENISGLDSEQTPSKVSTAARRARLHASICAMPEGYQTILDVQGSTLSTFERNQLALARAFYHTPKLLIVDELDLDMMIRIPRKLKETFTGLMKEGTTILVLARQPLNLAYASRRFRLEDGRLMQINVSAANAPEKISTPKKGNVSPIKLAPASVSDKRLGG